MSDVTKIEIGEMCSKLKDDGISLEQIGKLLGVSRLQVGNYIKGKTKVPKVNVCMNALENVVINGKPALTGPYVDEAHLRNTYAMSLI